MSMSKNIQDLTRDPISYVIVRPSARKSASCALQTAINPPFSPRSSPRNPTGRDDDRSADHRHAKLLPLHDRPIPQKRHRINLPLPNPLLAAHLHPTRPHRRRAPTPLLQSTRPEMGSVRLHRRRQQRLGAHPRGGKALVRRGLCHVGG